MKPWRSGEPAPDVFVYVGNGLPGSTNLYGLGPQDKYIKALYGAPTSHSQFSLPQWDGSSYLSWEDFTLPNNGQLELNKSYFANILLNYSWYDTTFDNLPWKQNLSLRLTCFDADTDRAIFTKTILWSAIGDGFWATKEHNYNLELKRWSPITINVPFSTSDFKDSSGHQIEGDVDTYWDLEGFAKYTPNTTTWLFSDHTATYPGGTGSSFVYYSKQYIGEMRAPTSRVPMNISSGGGGGGGPQFTADCWIGVSTGESISPSETFAPALYVDNLGPACNIAVVARCQGHDVTLISSKALAANARDVKLNIPSKSIMFYTGQLITESQQVMILYKVGAIGSSEVSEYQDSIYVQVGSGDITDCPAGEEFDPDTLMCRPKAGGGFPWLWVAGGAVLLVGGGTAAYLISKKRRK